MEIFKVKIQNLSVFNMRETMKCSIYNSKADYTKTVWDKTAIFIELQANQFSIQGVISNVVSYGLDLLLQGQILKSAIFQKFICDYFANDERYATSDYWQWRRCHGLSNGIWYLTLAHSKGEGQGHAILTTNILEMVTYRVKLLLPSNSKSCMAHLHLTLAHSKGQGHAHFDN